jgi:putative hydrolase of HD superfamily
MEEILDFLYKIMALKKVKRAGWNKDITKNGKRYYCRVDGAESVADHTWSTAMMAMLLLVDMDRNDKFEILVMILIHDLPEVISGDPMTPFLNKQENKQKEKDEMTIFIDLVKELPKELRDWLIALFQEYLEQKTWRARFVKSCDYTDPIIQATVYARDPKNIVDPSEFAETNIPKMKIPAIAKIFSE